MIKYALYLLVLYAAFQLTHANYISLPFTSASEGREADTTVDITRNGRVLAPYPNSMRIPSKPPLLHWVAAGVSAAFGTESEWALRVANVLGCFVFSLAVFFIARQFMPDPAALAASVLSFAIIPFWKYSCAFRVDMWLTAGIYLVVLQFIRMLEKDSFGWKDWAIFWFCILLTIFAKGPVGIAFLLAPIFIYVFLERRFSRCGSLKFIVVFCIMAAVVLSWMFYCANAYDNRQPGEERQNPYWQKVYGEMTMRFTDDPSIAHTEAAKPIYYGLLQAFVDLMPLTFFLVPAIIYFIRNRKSVPPGLLFLAIMFMWVLLLVTLIPKKRDVYNLPAYGAGIIVCVYYLHARFAESNVLQKSAVAVGALVIVGCAYAMLALAPSETSMRRVQIEIDPAELKPFLSVGMVAGLLIVCAGMLKNILALLGATAVLLAAVGAASDSQLHKTLAPGGKTELAKQGLRGPHEFKDRFSEKNLVFCDFYDSLIYYYSRRSVVPVVSPADLPRLKNSGVVCDPVIEVPAGYKFEFEFLNQIGKPIRCYSTP